VQKRVLAVAAAAARRTARDGSSSAGRVTATSIGATGLGLFRVEAVLGDRGVPSDTKMAAGPAAAAVAPGGAAASRDGGGGGGRGPPKAAVLVVSDRLEGGVVARAMGMAPGVSSVVQDRWITVAQSSGAGEWRMCCWPLAVYAPRAAPAHRPPSGLLR
jgi:hypothetical protein